ncbi:AIM24 domain-containing protein [Senna tora]|uniref:AIM24 domain-containing protein n=1 Tax=Senna tora TaxID=362788 RepID=A0A834WM44_9FABA|nr:AIM24 domain-containing protein [Senna tora]
MAAPFFSTPFQPFVYQNLEGWNCGSTFNLSILYTLWALLESKSVHLFVFTGEVLYLIATLAETPQDVVIPFQILGGEAQVVQIMLRPQEKVIAKPGSMCFMSGSIEMENTYLPENEVGMWQWLFGKTVTSIVLHNHGPSDGFVGIAAPSLARIIPPDAFLCSVNDVKVSNTIDQRARIRNAVAGAEGFLKQKLSGQGLAFIIAGGSVVQKNLEVGEVLAVDVSCVAAVTSTVNIQIKYNGPARKAIFGGDNAVTALLTGPGIVFIQSLPFHRFSQRIARAVTSPNMKENPKFFIQIAIFFFLAYVVIVSSLLLTDV